MAHIQYFNDTLCFPANLYFHEYSEGPGKGDVIKDNYVPYKTYCSQRDRGVLQIVRSGKGEGSYALIALDSIPGKYRSKILNDYDTPEKLAVEMPFVEKVRKDEDAFAFYAEYKHADGSGLNTKKFDNVTRLGNSASILNTVEYAYREHIAARAKLGKGPLRTVFFENMANLIRESAALSNRFPHNLPTNGRRLRPKYENYVKYGYNSLIKNYKGNVENNAAKIDDKLGKLLLFIASLDTHPYHNKIVDYYLEFMRGEREIYDESTGEYFDPADYLDENGNVIEFTKEAAWYHLNKPGVQVKLDRTRFGYKDFNDMHRPYNHRHSPIFSFSKISLDDRDLIWKDRTTKKRIKAYYAYDVTSGCRVGSSYSEFKDEELFLDCLRDMFVFIDRNGFGMPLEVEVENHLVNKFFDDLTRMFPILTICAPGNSREKRAEHFNRAVKYQVEKNNHPGVGRWWLSSRFNKISVDKVNDQFKETMKDRDRLIVDDIQDTLEYNNSLHPNQKKYPGMTRMQVLVNNLNPNLPQLNKSLIYRYIGNETADVKINNSQFVRVQYQKYMLPDPRVLDLLQPNNREVTAYWLPDSEGSINEVYLYQNGEFICTAGKIIEYNEAKAERTEEDEAAKLAQDKYRSMFDKYVKDGKEEIGKIKTNKITTKPSSMPEPVIVEDKKQPADESLATGQQAVTDYAQKALNDFFQ